MPTEGDMQNFLDALSDLRAKLHYREEIKNLLNSADRAVLESMSKLRGISNLHFSDEHHELDAMLQATHMLLTESLVRKDFNETEKEQRYKDRKSTSTI